MPGFWKRLENVINEADIVLELVDARFPDSMRNKSIEELVKRKRKKLVLILNKADLVSSRKLNEHRKRLEKEIEVVTVSVKNRKGKMNLKGMIGRLAPKKDRIYIGFVGYPNSGKSSLLNYLAGRKAAKTSVTPGYTRGEQLVKMAPGIYLLDSPGIIPFKEWGEEKLVLVGAKNASQVKDVEGAAEHVIAWLEKNAQGALKAKYGADGLEGIALKRNLLRKGGKANEEAAARLVLKEWIEGKIELK